MALLVKRRLLASSFSGSCANSAREEQRLSQRQRIARAELYVALGPLIGNFDPSHCQLCVLRIRARAPPPLSPTANSSPVSPGPSSSRPMFQIAAVLLGRYSPL
jgi:hypothetical protein